MNSDKVVSVCFILTSNRRHETYEAILRCLKRIESKMGLNLKPLTIICDFEQAFTNAVAKEVYVFLPQTIVTGCWFHFCQLCYRNAQELGMMKLYHDDTELRELLRDFMDLALLPIDRVHEGYEILKQRVTTSSHTKQLDTFVSYFENEWLNVFKPSSWSVNQST
ncbi:unnamed protein product, partial [Didymodactylos carnosus]